MRRRGTWAVTAGPCPSCGAKDWEERRQGLLRSLARWVLHGGPLRRTERACRRCGHRGGSTAYLLYGGTDGPWRIPLGLLRNRRTMQPVPVTYLAVGGVGTALGLSARRLLGWRWWAVPAGAVGATWLFFASSALWGPPGRASLLTDLLTVVSPSRGRARQRAEDAERYRRVPFPLFGLDASFEGPRTTGGIGSSWSREAGERIEEAGLLHGDPLAPRAPRLRVTTRRPRFPEPDRRRQLAERLWHEALDPPPEGLSPQGLARWADQRRREIGERPDPTWETRGIPVDGRAVPFSYLEAAGHWVATASVGDLVVELGGRFPPESVSLTGSVDVEVYLRGSRTSFRPE